MAKRDNFESVNEVRNTLHKIKQLTLESFVMPGEQNPYEGGMPSDREEMMAGEEMETQQNQPMYDEEVKQAIVKIRKIAIGIIAKLADNPVSESYTFMKRVLDMSDKAMESMNNGGETK